MSVEACHDCGGGGGVGHEQGGEEKERMRAELERKLTDPTSILHLAVKRAEVGREVGREGGRSVGR